MSLKKLILKLGSLFNRRQFFNLYTYSECFNSTYMCQQNILFLCIETIFLLLLDISSENTFSRVKKSADCVIRMKYYHTLLTRIVKRDISVILAGLDCCSNSIYLVTDNVSIYQSYRTAITYNIKQKEIVKQTKNGPLLKCFVTKNIVYLHTCCTLSINDEE